MGVASLVLGIISIVIGLYLSIIALPLWFISLTLAVPGLILGVAEPGDSGMRTAGIVLNIIGLAISSIWIVLFFIL